MATKNNLFKLEKILELLPHRFPFLLIDRVLYLENGHFLRAVKNVSFNEPFFPGHFPNKPIFPGVLIIEAMAQATGILAFRRGRGDKLKPGELYYLASIDKARFKRRVLPGDQMILEVEFIKERSGIARFRGRANVNNELVCEASFMCTRHLKT
ncbi:MAG: 3-hydroxyacyl-ACP dehydratase FabZ [Candidatus Dasytiphilus stammeri]